MKSLKLLVANLLLLTSSVTHAITIINNTSQQLHFIIFTSMYGVTCTSGYIYSGKQLTWVTEGSNWMYYFCGGKYGPTHVEVNVISSTGQVKHCSRKNSNTTIRLKNYKNAVTVTEKRSGKISCYTH